MRGAFVTVALLLSACAARYLAVPVPVAVREKIEPDLAWACPFPDRANELGIGGSGAADAATPPLPEDPNVQHLP